MTPTNSANSNGDWETKIIRDMKKPIHTPGIPEGATRTEEYFGHANWLSRYPALTAWGQAVTINPTANNSSVDMLYICAIEVDLHNVQTKEVCLTANNFEYSHSVGGLYMRGVPGFGWFPDANLPLKDRKPLLSAKVDKASNLIKIDTGNFPENISHFWTPRLQIRPSHKYYLEAAFRTYGDVAVQFGLDYWKSFHSGTKTGNEDCTTGDNCDAWVSDWYQSSGQKITVFRSPMLD